MSHNFVIKLSKLCDEFDVIWSTKRPSHILKLHHQKDHTPLIRFRERIVF